MRFLATLLFCSPLAAQTFEIVPSTASRGEAGSLQVKWISPAGKEPVALQWKINLRVAVTAAAEDIVAGDAATMADKAVTCAAVTKPVQDNVTFNCILAGGQKQIANGTIFLVKYKVKPKVTPQTRVVRVSDGIAVLDHSKQLQKMDIPTAEGAITIR